MTALCAQLLLDAVGDARLAGAGQARQPQHAGPLSLLPGPQPLVDVERLPVHVLRAPQREMNQPRSHRRIADAVDEDEAAKGAVARVRLERDRLVELDLADADVVELEALRGRVLERVDV